MIVVLLIVSQLIVYFFFDANDGRCRCVEKHRKEKRWREREGAFFVFSGETTKRVGARENLPPKPQQPTPTPSLS